MYNKHARPMREYNIEKIEITLVEVYIEWPTTSASVFRREMERVGEEFLAQSYVGP